MDYRQIDCLHEKLDDNISVKIFLHYKFSFLQKTVDMAHLQTPVTILFFFCFEVVGWKETKQYLQICFVN